MSDYFVEELNLENQSDWEKFNEKVKGGSFFHTLKWKNILEKSFNYKPYYFLLYCNNKIISACPFYKNNIKGFRGLTILPDSDYNNILINDNLLNPLVIKEILNKTKELAKNDKLSYILITSLSEKIDGYYDKFNFIKFPDSGNMILDLKQTKPQEIWDKTFTITDKGKPRKIIKKFEKEGFKIKPASSIEDLKIFYKYYKENFEYKNIKYYSYNHFKELWNTYSSDEMRIKLLHKGHVVYGGLLLFLFVPKKTIYIRYMSLNRPIIQKYSPSFYLYWDAVLNASDQGFNTLCFGATPLNISSVNYRTKMKFGCSYEKQYSVISPLSIKFKMSYKVYNILKKFHFHSK